jgi:hypothetical protein
MTENEEIEAEQPTDNSREGKKAAAALDSVTDHHEEKEFSGGASTHLFFLTKYLHKN